MAGGKVTGQCPQENRSGLEPTEVRLLTSLAPLPLGQAGPQVRCRGHGPSLYTHCKDRAYGGAPA